mmetsp:Transcript_102891/g.276406  ORF Transcript_102891/g.276406 Transcript_102891/m.276406 type:complete len:430 (+) Transcript_102891:211-1500(+)
MSRDRCMKGSRSSLELEGDVAVGAVQDHDRDLAIGAEEGGGLQAVIGGACAVGPHRPGIGRCVGSGGLQALGPRHEVLREVAHGVVLRMNEDLAAGGVGQDGCIADVVHVVRATILVQEQVPIDPARGTSIEVANDVVGIALAERPVAGHQSGAGPPAVTLERRLRGQELGLGEVRVHASDMIEGVSRVPMEGDAGGVLLGPGVGVQGLGPIVDMILVVVEDENFDVWVVCTQGGPQVLAQELQLLLGVVHASLPARRVFGFVLGGDRPDRDATGLVCAQPLGKVRGPNCLAAVLQPGFVRAIHLPVRLHPCGRAPRRGDQLQFCAIGLADLVLSGQDQRDHDLGVVGHTIVEVRQAEVAIDVVEGVALRGEVAAVHVHPAQGVSYAVRAEVEVEHLLLLVRGQAFEDERAGLREGTSETLNHLIGAIL